MTRTRTFLIAIVAGVGLAVALWALVLPRLRPHVFTGTVMQSETLASDVALITTTGDRASIRDYRGKLVVLYFGYTFCPDVCPTTLSTLAKVVDDLGGKAEDVQVIMVSVDPARDTPDVLADYLGYFDPRFVGMTGSEEEIAEVATVYGVFFEAQEGSVDTGYLVAHSARVMVVDRDGYLKLLLPTEATVNQIVSDLEYLL